MDRERVTIEKSVYGGEGMGRLKDGRSVFVPYVLPGEVVKVEIVNSKKRFAKASPLEWLSVSEARIAPPCPYFGECGGCHYQFLPYGEQVDLKQQILEDQFSRLAGLNGIPLKVIEISEKEFHYRNTIRLSAAQDGQLGFLRHNSNELIPVDDCMLSKGNLKRFLKQFALLPEMEINSVQFRWDSDDEVVILIDSDDIVPPEISIDFSGSIVHTSPAGELVLAGDGTQLFRINDVPFVVSAQSFFQTNTFIAERMVDFIQKRLPDTSDGVLIDLYSGVGLFSRFFANQFSRCIGIESSPSAVGDYAVNLDEFENIEVFEDIVEDVLPSIDVSPDVVIMDPPRAGVDGTVVDWLAKNEVPLVIYVSCDPSTLARDIKRLIQQGYELDEIAMFDQFPQTYHIETISILKRQAILQ